MLPFEWADGLLQMLPFEWADGLLRMLFESFFEWTLWMLLRMDLLELQSKDTVIMPIEVLVHNANRKAPSECQSKGLSECQSKCSSRMPIEGLLQNTNRRVFQNANRSALSECQSKCLKHHSKIFFFLRQGFVIKHAGGRLWKTWEGKFWGATVAPVQFS